MPAVNCQALWPGSSQGGAMGLVVAAAAAAEVALGIADETDVILAVMNAVQSRKTARVREGKTCLAGKEVVHQYVWAES